MPPKTSNPQKKPGVKPAPPPAPQSALADEPSTDDATKKAAAVLARLLARWPALTEAQRAAFRSFFSDEQADELGKKSRAADVRDEGARWAVLIDAALREYPSALPRYTPVRFAYYLECLQALHDAIVAEETKRAQRGEARDSAQTAREEALEVRQELRSTLRTYAGGRKEERAAIAKAYGTIDTDDNLAGSLKKLADLGEKWLGRKDESSRILAENTGLTKDLVDKARRCAGALTAKGADVSLEGRATVKDTPAINRIEGRFTWEMLEAGRLFAEANQKNPLVQKLVPGPAVRHLFKASSTVTEGGDAEPGVEAGGEGAGEGGADG
jgi:hypothetical protein